MKKQYCLWLLVSVWFLLAGCVSAQHGTVNPSGPVESGNLVEFKNRFTIQDSGISASTFSSAVALAASALQTSGGTMTGTFVLSDFPAEIVVLDASYRSETNTLHYIQMLNNKPAYGNADTWADSNLKLRWMSYINGTHWYYTGSDAATTYSTMDGDLPPNDGWLLSGLSVDEYQTILEEFTEDTGKYNDLKYAIESETFVIMEPDAAQAVNDKMPLKFFPATKYPNGVELQAIHIGSSDQYTSETFYFMEGYDTQTFIPVEPVTLTAAYEAEDDGDIGDPDIAADHYIFIDLDNTPEDVDYVIVTLTWRVK